MRYLLPILLLTLLLPPPIHSGLYDYICKEDQLFRPYLRIYQGRRGKLLTTLGPGFHLIDPSLQNIWVCINGPAFLYYAKNTSLGLVYEAPQPFVYSHACEMQNVIPRTPQAKISTLILSLLAVLLYGNATDYRAPFIQPFTAPYLFKEGEYSEGTTTANNLVPFPAHYQNATSVAIIGRMDCKLVKGSLPGIPLIFHPTPADIPAACLGVTCDDATPSVPPVAASTEVVGSICRLGFSKDLLNVSATPPELLLQRKGLVNSESIGEGSCRPDKMNEAEYTAKKAEIDVIKKSATDATTKMTTWVADHDKKVDDTAAALQTEIDGITAKISPPTPARPPNAKVLAKLEARKKALEEAKTLEEAKKAPFTTLHGDMVTAATIAEPTTDAKTTADLWTALETKLADPDLEKRDVPLADKDTKKTAIYTDKIAALTASATAWKALSDYEVAVAKLTLAVAQVQKAFNGYTPTKPVLKKKAKPTTKKRVEYKEPGQPVEYTIGGTGAGVLGECTSLPVMGGPGGACKKGKPDPKESCDLFQVALGLDKTPWEADQEWKGGVLKDLATIFSNACPYFPNRAKFLTRLNRLMTFYLRSPEHFNLDKPAEGTSSACLIIKDWRNGLGVPPLVTPPATAPAPGPTPIPNTIRRPFWDQIDQVLKDCKEAKNNTLVFMDRSELYGKWKWVKIHPNGDTSEHDIVPMKEQAEEENVFNWVIDMTWRIFGTVLGICVVDHEDRIPHVASKFQSLFTEDFLIPLAETWINSKDNVLFQWILGEFYNGDAEDWGSRCMEASFLRSDRLREFRPPRSLLVNCESEYNYFIGGDLASEGGVLPLGREQYNDFN